MDPDNEVNKAMVRGPNNLVQGHLSDWIDKLSERFAHRGRKEPGSNSWKRTCVE